MTKERWIALIFGILFLVTIGLIVRVNAEIIYGTPLGRVPLATRYKIYNQSFPAANVIYKVTTEAGNVAGSGISINVQAVGGDIRYAVDGTTTEAYWTIIDGATYWDHFPIPIPVSKEFCFYTTSTSTPQVQVLYSYY
jgi:hypothetical protein